MYPATFVCHEPIQNVVAIYVALDRDSMTSQVPVDARKRRKTSATQSGPALYPSSTSVHVLLGVCDHVVTAWEDGRFGILRHDTAVVGVCLDEAGRPSNNDSSTPRSGFIEADQELEFRSSGLNSAQLSPVNSVIAAIVLDGTKRVVSKSQQQTLNPLPTVRNYYPVQKWEDRGATSRLEPLSNLLEVT